MEQRQTRRSSRLNNKEKLSDTSIRKNINKSIKNGNRKENINKANENNHPGTKETDSFSHNLQTQPKKKLANPDSFKKDLFDKPPRVAPNSNKLVKRVESLLASFDQEDIFEDNENNNLISKALEKQKLAMDKMLKLEERADSKSTPSKPKSNKKSKKKEEPEATDGPKLTHTFNKIINEKKKSKATTIDSETLEALIKDLENKVDGDYSIDTIVNKTDLFVNKGNDNKECTSTMKRRITEIVKDAQYNQRTLSFQFLKEDLDLSNSESKKTSFFPIPISIPQQPITVEFKAILEACLNESNHLTPVHFTQLLYTINEPGAIEVSLDTIFDYFFKLSDIATTDLLINNNSTPSNEPTKILNLVKFTEELDEEIDLPYNLPHIVNFLTELLKLRKLDNKVDSILVLCQLTLLMLMDYRLTPFTTHITETFVTAFYTLVRIGISEVEKLFNLLVNHFVKIDPEDKKEGFEKIIQAQILLVTHIPTQRFRYPDERYSRVLIEFKSRLANHFLNLIIEFNNTSLEVTDSQLLHLSDTPDAPYTGFQFLYTTLLPKVPFPIKLDDPYLKKTKVNTKAENGSTDKKDPKGGRKEGTTNPATWKLESIYRNSQLVVANDSLPWLLYKVQLIDLTLHPSLLTIEHRSRVKILSTLLQYVHDKIVDTKAANLERTQVKEHLQLLYLRLNYFIKAWE